MLELLRRFRPFDALTWHELSTVARHTQLLCIPGKRWLVKPGRRIGGAYYLCKGSVRTYDPDAVVRHRSERARATLYPGSRGLRTLCAAQILAVDVRPIAFLLDGDNRLTLGLPVELEPWEKRFLETPVMRSLDAHQWQRVLRGLHRTPMDAGAYVTRTGQPGTECFVLRSGRARVLRRGAAVCELGPGDFFGEDALIASGYRNACVRMESQGEVSVLPGSVFRETVLASVVQFEPERRPDRVPVWICDGDAPPQEGEATATTSAAIPLEFAREAIARLPRAERYVVLGGNREQRALIAFLMISCGLWARALA